MKHLVFLFLLQILINPLFAQSTDFTKLYHPQINQAELALIKSDYSAALKHYQTAFANVEKGFASDYHNAITCMLKLKKTKSPKLYDYIEMLIKKGVNYSYFETDLYNSIRNNKRWDWLFKKYEFTAGRCLTFINIELYNELRNFAKKDQKFRIKEGSYEVHGDTIYKIDSILMERFKTIVQEYGYPSEDIIGIEYPEENRIPYSIVMHHYFQRRSNKEWKYLTDMSPMIISAIKKGALKPQKGSYWIALQNGDFHLGSLTLTKFQSDDQLLDGLYVEKISIDKLKEINQNRLSIGVPLLQDFYRKAIFLQNNKETAYLLSQRGGIDTWHGDAAFINEILPYFSRLDIENN
mgnify:CR=1 FL=1